MRECVFRTIGYDHDMRVNASHMFTEVAQYTKWGLDNLVASARTLYETQLLHLTAQLELEGQVRPPQVPL
jgi:hypothetical protein